MIRSIVLLPQPDGPISTPTSPDRSANFTGASTSCVSPAALLKVLPVISTSSRTGPPPCCTGLERLYQHRLDHEHDGGEGEGIGEQPRRIEQLESDADLEADAVRASQQFGDQHDLPYQRQPGAGRGRDIGR